MSLESWMEEYYTPAEECAGTDVEALEQGLRKWVGFYEWNRKEHGVSLEELPDDGPDCACCIGIPCDECLFHVILGMGCGDAGYSDAKWGDPAELLNNMALMMHKIMEKEMGCELDIWPTKENNSKKDTNPHV